MTEEELKETIPQRDIQPSQSMSLGVKIFLAMVLVIGIPLTLWISVVWIVWCSTIGIELIVWILRASLWVLEQLLNLLGWLLHFLIPGSSSPVLSELVRFLTT